MYNAKLINDFIEKVNEEAEQAAQKVFDRYEEKYIKLVTGQLKIGDHLYISMGSGYFDQKKENTDAQEKIVMAVSSNEYLEQRAAFTTTEFNK